MKLKYAMINIEINVTCEREGRATSGPPICQYLAMETVSLPRGRIQEIKRMLLVYLTHGLFLTWTQKSRYIVDHMLQYLQDI